MVLYSWAAVSFVDILYNGRCQECSKQGSGSRDLLLRIPALNGDHEMDEEAQALDNLERILSALAETPYNLALHVEHIAVARTLTREELLAAYDMTTTYLPMGDEIWIPVLESMLRGEDLGEVDGCLLILENFARAEADYLCKLSHKPAISISLICISSSNSIIEEAHSVSH